MSPKDDRPEPREEEQTHLDASSDESLDQTLRLDGSDPSQVPAAPVPSPSPESSSEDVDDEMERTLIEGGGASASDGELEAATRLEQTVPHERSEDEDEAATLAEKPSDDGAEDGEDATLIEGRAADAFDTNLERATNVDRDLDTGETERGTVVGDATAATVPGQTARRRHRDEDLVGTTLGGCELSSLLGKGAMGAVYKAEQLSLQRTVAVKTIRPEYCEEENFLKRFRQEALVVGRFNTPYVVQIYDVGLEEGFHYILMEYVAAGSLLDRLKRLPDNRLDVPSALRWIRQTAEGLLEAERLSVVHRDIKPANLLIDDNDRVKIADFGVAKSLESSIELTQSDGILGTPLYMSPEQCEGKALDSRSDQYSVGATFYQALTGKPPFQAESVYAILQQKTTVDFLSPRAALDLDTEDVPEPLNAVIERMTQKDPDLRYATFQDLIDDLDAIEQGLAPTPVPRRRSEKSSAGVLTAIVAIIVLGVAGYFIYTEVIAPGQEDPKTGDLRKADVGIPTIKTGDDKVITEPEPRRPDPGTGRPPSAPFDWGSFASKVTAYTEEFATRGPSSTLEQDATELRSTQIDQTAPASATTAKAQLDLLLDSIGTANQLRTAEILNATSPLRQQALQFPFAGLSDYWRKVSQPFENLRAEEAPWLGKWIDDSLNRERGRLLTDLGGALEKERVSLLEKKSQFEGWSLDVDAWESSLDIWDQSQTTLAAFMGETETTLAIEPAADAVNSWRTGITVRRTILAAIADFESGLEKLETRADQNLASRDVLWPSAQELEELAARASTLRGTLQAAPLADAQLPDSVFATSQRLTRLTEIETTALTWSTRRELVSKALEALARRDVRAATESLRRPELASMRDKDPIAGLLSSQAAIAEGFDALIQRLDLETCQKRFEVARRDLSASAEVFEQADDESFATLARQAERYPARCTERLEALQAATRNMAKCQGGTAKPDGESVAVAPFFVDRHEVSVERYEAFMKWLAENRDKGLVLFDGNEERWSDAIKGPDYLTKSPEPYPQGPIQFVTYFESVAFTRHEEKSLPRLAEWWVAAKGSVESGIRRFAWDPNPDARGLPRDDAVFSYNADQPMSVDRGEQAAGFKNGPSVHHLAGNVAEWLLDDGNGREAELAGGAYSDRASRESRFAGEDRYREVKRERLSKYGLRGVLRPAEFFGELAPKSD